MTWISRGYVIGLILGDVVCVLDCVACSASVFLSLCFFFLGLCQYCAKKLTVGDSFPLTVKTLNAFSPTTWTRPPSLVFGSNRQSFHRSKETGASG